MAVSGWLPQPDPAKADRRVPRAGEIAELTEGAALQGSWGLQGSQFQFSILFESKTLSIQRKLNNNSKPTGFHLRVLSPSPGSRKMALLSPKLPGRAVR